jgi:transposase InsO family protein
VVHRGNATASPNTGTATVLTSAHTSPRRTPNQARHPAQRMRPSIGRKGSWYDSAVAEAFFATLKTERPTTTWTTCDQARTDIFAVRCTHAFCALVDIAAVVPAVAAPGDW